ncbi:cytochrome P450 [Amycolatopsis sp. AA4]|uniref:cytochrome P450 n=1 Tax=Actinomycetes TaxID=1760 RepID=UPI0001B56000|nr:MULTISPECIES: cytochrome P450 [Actinomycetes]ATY11202.1 cytochrome P450 [Amycolatopsis sp. AA4]EFL06784.1 cytochrome P450 [Streptomyces sp. AA4]
MTGSETFPMARAAGCPFAPAPGLTERPPVSRVRLWDGSEPWLITRYADVRAVLADPRVSVDVAQPGFPHTNAVSKARDARMKTLMQLDPPEHPAQRRRLAPEFTVRRMAALRPRIQELVDDLLDQLLAGPDPADLVESFALPLPSLVICELLGVPYADRDFFQGVARTLVMDNPDPARAVAASEELNAYLEDLVAAKAAAPGDDLLSKLAASPEPMSPREIAVLGQLLLVAGHDTTAAMIALGTAVLLTHPEQFRDSSADPVEELLRYLSITHTEARRVALADLEIGGQLIRAGEGIIAVKSTANRDPLAFPDPDRFDVRRPARHHVAFGYGRHLCLGAPLARVELEIAFSTLRRRVPGLALAVPVDRLEFKENAVFYSVRELPVTWGGLPLGSSRGSSAGG